MAYLNKTVPRNLMPGPNSFGAKTMPYAYPIVKHKCLEACVRKVGGTIIYPDQAKIPTPLTTIFTPPTRVAMKDIHWATLFHFGIFQGATHSGGWGESFCMGYEALHLDLAWKI